MSDPPPITADATMTMAQALRTMRRHAIRHLPVVRDGRLIGLLSERDLFERRDGLDEERVTLEELVFGTEVVTVEPHAELATVAELMHARRIGSVVVTERDQIVGLFTTSDALRALAQITARVC